MTAAAPRKARTPTLKLTPPPEPDPLEAWHQAMIFRMAALNAAEHPELDDLYAVPNGGWRHKAVAKSLQEQGVKPGVPDMCLPHARGGWFALHIELKRFREGEISDAQRERIERLRAAGYRAVVCWGWREAWAELLRYLSLSSTVPTVLPHAYDPFKLRPGSRAAKAAAAALPASTSPVPPCPMSR